MRTFLITVSTASALAGCATPSTRISTALQERGLDAPRADCVGGRLERNLSVDQLLQLSRTARAVNEGDATPGRFTLSDLVRVAATIDDPRVPLEVGRAVAACDLIP